ncbi:MAG TPA: hypothetical protein VEA80_12810 [Vitreimonas sp.]|uniref:CC0125/CC1285 family lipoprotein n=1 Tax=Vitreimonas sp. TaxID=3069702 RepID=UPI002D7053F9|nr:hypothetical protein [Vitreimonas sp.]HYD88349.1 hypothetical protein [Vitreimonas sp.]
MLRHLIFIAAAAALAACASTPPPYAPAPGQGAAGYSETQIESNRYFVTFRAPSGADPALLQDYALLRAADLTLQNGREWFWVDRRTLDEQSTRATGPSVGIGVGGGSWGSHSGGSVGVGINLPLGGQRQVARSATLEIRMGEGAKPDDPNAYDARAIATNLRSRLAG